jgi:hypothetical protein
MGRAGLHQPCLIILAGLTIQLALGLVLNLYVAVPASDAQASYLREIETAPVALTAHALVALLLIATAALMLLRAIALRDVAVIALVATGLAALLGAFVAGEVFVRNGADSTSLTMGMLTGASLLCYIILEAVITRPGPLVAEGRHVPKPRSRPSAERAAAPPRTPGTP